MTSDHDDDCEVQDEEEEDKNIQRNEGKNRERKVTNK
jgi:hypothetical protein